MASTQLAQTQLASSLVALLLLKVVLVLALLLGLTLLWLELRHRLRPASPLQLRADGFQVEPTPAGLEVTGTVTISNPHRRMEVMVPEIQLKPTLLGRGDLAGVTVSARIEALHPDEESRPVPQRKAELADWRRRRSVSRVRYGKRTVHV